jgi:hypothetical protein
MQRHPRRGLVPGAFQLLLTPLRLALLIGVVQGYGLAVHIFTH